MEILVLTGEQAGARSRLEDNRLFTISGDMDTDMVFRDSSISNEKINLITNNNEVFIQVLSGDIEVQGSKVEQGKQIKLPEYAKVKVGDTTFTCARQLDKAWDEILVHVTELENAALSNTGLKLHYRENRLIYILFALLIIITVSLIIISMINSHRSLNDISMSNIDNISSVLIENGFETLTVTQYETGELAISGYVLTNHEKAEIENLLDRNQIPAVLDLVIGEQMAIEVRELFRLNGFNVDASAESRGVIMVSTNKGDMNGLERIKTIALNEIANLENLEIDLHSESPVATNIGIGQELPFSRLDKRITMVVDGDPAYILTSDQSRYYVGAILPTGHKILSIANKTVVLEKKGEETTLNF